MNSVIKIVYSSPSEGNTGAYRSVRPVQKLSEGGEIVPPKPDATPGKAPVS